MKSDLMTTPIEFFHSHTNFFHELARVGGKKNSNRSVGPITSGPMLCSSSVVPRLVKSVIISAPIECFYGHTNLFHELTSVVST